VSAEDEVAGKAAEHIIARVVEQAGVHDAETLVSKIERVSAQQVQEAERLAVEDAVRRGESRSPSEFLSELEREQASRLTAGQRDRLVSARALAIENEKQITPQLREIADQAGMELVHLDQAVKTQSSLDRKIGGELIRDGQGTVLHENQFTNSLTKVNDVVRYTMVAPEAEYADATSRAIRAMEDKGFVLEQVPPKNNWLNETGYRGVNSTWIASLPAEGSGEKVVQRFEMQFHTPESFAAKDGTHRIYDFARVADSRLAGTFQSLQNEVFDLVPIPEGTTGGGSVPWPLGGATS